MSYSIQHLLHIAAPKNEVYQALSTIHGLKNWWTVQTQGNENLDGEIQFDFGEFSGPKMKVTTLIVGEQVQWECVADNHGWLGNTFTFTLDEKEGKTRIRFSHDGWAEQGNFYASCNFTWGRYLESLRQYCQTGKGAAFGSEGYQ